MVPGKPGCVRGLISSCTVTTTGGCNASVIHLAALFLARMAPALMTMVVSFLVQQQCRFLQDGSDVGHEAGGQVAVHHPVVERAAEGGDPARNHFPVQHPGLLL